MSTHYIAVADGPAYPVVGLGRSADEAKAAAFAEWQKGNPHNQIVSAYGGPLLTVEAFDEYFGFWVAGPLADGQGETK
jgi:hypothetical protein